MTTVLYCAAHSGFELGRVPLGGGAAICDRLARAWQKTRPFAFRLLGPSLLGASSPQEKDLVRYSELEYARFCRRFEAALTAEILTHDPAQTLVLCNDVAEGPDFKRLSEKGYRLYTIYHVDVVDYFAAIYLRGALAPERTAAFYRKSLAWGLGGLWPDVLKLVWQKQEDSVRSSRGLLVPSAPMKEILLRSYPALPSGRIHVLPWGAWDDACPEAEVAEEVRRLQELHPIAEGSPSLLMLSRISPEKGQHRLLEALRLWEKDSDFPAAGVTLFISGEAAYMMGKKYEQRLKIMAKKLRRCTVYFVGYAAGAKKKALFALSDIYVFPSIHESYGLTLLEALRAGLPVLCTASHGAQEVFRPEFGAMVPQSPPSSVAPRLRDGLRMLLRDPQRLEKIGSLAAAWARSQDFSAAASRLAELLASQ